MTSEIQTLALFVTSGALNAVGAALQRYASETGDVVMGVLGCLCWAATSLPFLALLNNKHDLAFAAAITAASGVASVALIGWLWFGEALSLRQSIALVTLILSVFILSLPTNT